MINSSTNYLNHILLVSNDIIFMIILLFLLINTEIQSLFQVMSQKISFKVRVQRQQMNSKIQMVSSHPYTLPQKKEDKIINITNADYINRRNKYSHAIRQSLDPRDRQFIFLFNAAFNISSFNRQTQEKRIQTNSAEQKSTSQRETGTRQHMKQNSLPLLVSSEFSKMRREIYNFIAEMCENLNSITFEFLNEEKLSNHEAKSFASKNILANIQSILSEIKLKFIEYQITSEQESECLLQELTLSIDKELKQIMSQLSSYYPQAPAVGATARMREVLVDINRVQDQTNDLIYANKIKIGDYAKNNKNDPERYTGFIMEVISKAINITREPFTNESDITIFEKFHEFSEMLFYIAEQKSFNEKIKQFKTTKIQINDEEFELFQSKVIDYFTQLLDSKKINLEPYPHLLQSNEKQETLQQFRGKATYKIQKKIPNHALPFDNIDMKAGKFYIDNSSVLRIMTKWAEYLEDIFQKPEIYTYQRLYEFKDTDNKKVKLDKTSKEKLCNNIKKQYQQIKKALKEIQKKNTLFQSYILSENQSCTTYLKRFTEVRSCSSQINLILIEFTRKYLCLLIHHLILAGKIFKNLTIINLVMFHVGDLMRSRLQCTESAFINVLKILSWLDESKKIEGKFKLVRIKDKLSVKDNNVLINYMFLGKVQCQLQLTMQDIQNKDKKYNSFNHFLYELTRGKFGVITECATIVSQHDPIVSSCKQPYYIPKQYQKKEQGKKKPLKIHEKDKNIYKCWKCKKLIIKDNIDLFINSQTACNQCIVKQRNPEQKLNNNSKEINGIKEYLLQNLSNKINNFKTIENCRYVLSISNGNIKRPVKLFRVWEHQRQLKLFMIEINESIKKSLQEKQKIFDYSKIDYFDISIQKEKQVQISELTYFLGQQDAQRILQFQKLDLSLAQLDIFLKQFENFRLEKMLIKSIKIKSQILDINSDCQTSDSKVSIRHYVNTLKLQVLNQITEELSNNPRKPPAMLRYKKYRMLEYNHIKEINIKGMDLLQVPSFLTYINHAKRIDLSYNKLITISLQNQTKLQQLQLYRNQIMSINLANNINLEKLYLDENQLETINLCNNINLAQLSLPNNKLTSIDLSPNTKIQQLNLRDNHLRFATFWYSPELDLQLQNQDSNSCEIILLHHKRDAQSSRRWGSEQVQRYNRQQNTHNCHYNLLLVEKD